VLTTSIIRAILMMEAASIYNQTTRFIIPEDSHLHHIKL
jgi:hypothetical protein